MPITEQIPIAAMPMDERAGSEARRAEFIEALRYTAILGFFTVILYRHVLAALFENWWTDPNYGYAFYMPLFASFVVWKMRKQLMAIELHPSWWGLLMAAAAMTLLIVGDLGAELFSARVSLLVLLVAIPTLTLGWNHVRALLFPFVMLLLVIPIPAILLNQITFPLQLTASQLATALLSLVGVPVLRDGNVIEVPAKTLEVVEACSGIRSLMSLIAVAAVFGYLKQRPSWQRWVLVLLAIPIAVIANSIRIMGTGLLAQYWDPEKAEGFFHMFEGWVIFVLSLLLLAVADMVISRCSPRKEPA